jgi:hypothetical protein
MNAIWALKTPTTWRPHAMLVMLAQNICKVVDFLEAFKKPSDE